MTPQLNLDKSHWKPVRFGDVVMEPKEAANDFAAAGIEHIVGLEHIDSESVHLRRSAGIDESTTFTKVFRTGDVLFGRRRAYLKKAAQAPFDGVCSGDITVFRAKKDLMPELLPFVVNNDKFFDHAVKHSAGGLSPRVKFKDLANYEFLLPPKDQQAELAELLWAMDGVIEGDSLSFSKLDNCAKSLFHSYLFEKSPIINQDFGWFSSRFDVVKLGECITDLQYGISESLSDSGGTPILRMNNLQNGELELSDLKYYDFTEKDLEKYTLHKGDLLFNRTNSFDLVGKVSLFDKDGLFSFASYLIRIVTDKAKLNPSFLNYYLNTSIGIAKIRKYRTPGVSQSNINAQNIKNIELPLPTIHEQNSLMKNIELLQKSKFQVSEKITASKALQKSLINQIF